MGVFNEKSWGLHTHTVQPIFFSLLKACKLSNDNKKRRLFFAYNAWYIFHWRRMTLIVRCTTLGMLIKAGVSVERDGRARPRYPHPAEGELRKKWRIEVTDMEPLLLVLWHSRWPFIVKTNAATGSRLTLLFLSWAFRASTTSSVGTLKSFLLLCLSTKSKFLCLAYFYHDNPTHAFTTTANDVQKPKKKKSLLHKWNTTGWNILM